MKIKKSSGQKEFFETLKDVAWGLTGVALLVLFFGSFDVNAALKKSEVVGQYNLHDPHLNVSHSLHFKSNGAYEFQDYRVSGGLSPDPACTGTWRIKGDSVFTVIDCSERGIQGQTKQQFLIPHPEKLKQGIGILVKLTEEQELTEMTLRRE